MQWIHVLTGLLAVTMFRSWIGANTLLDGSGARQYSGPYSPKKMIYEKASGAGSAVGWASYQLNSNNLHLLRYAEVILLLAECEIQVGSVDAGMVLINQIRTRAAAGAQGPDGGAVVVPIDNAGIGMGHV
ncbi:MAG: RagB/SusD family nutrient uptake outer membrane protein [Cyclobacteriaceae bacterium]|nr:RagB/SusD family nutrient uptake outer membrane protein [Cyclobacteriaceae bacterium]